MSQEIKILKKLFCRLSQAAWRLKTVINLMNIHIFSVTPPTRLRSSGHILSEQK